MEGPTEDVRSTSGGQVENYKETKMNHDTEGTEPAVLIGLKKLIG